jgi:hypothetical protein
MEKKNAGTSNEVVARVYICIYIYMINKKGI